MPLLVRSPLETSASDDLSLTHAIIDPDRNEEMILRNLQAWGRQITEHGFGDEDYIKALKMIEKDAKKRRRQAHAIAGDLHGYHKRPTLVQKWESEAERMLQQSAYEVKDPEIEKTWLRVTDRTRQFNGFLDDNDPERLRPRLVTRGLDQNDIRIEWEAAYTYYQTHGRRSFQNRYLISTDERVISDELPQPRRSLSAIFCWITGSEHGRSLQSTSTSRIQNYFKRLYSAKRLGDKPLFRPTQSLSDREANIPRVPQRQTFDQHLDFPCDFASARVYLRQTRTATRRPVPAPVSRRNSAPQILGTSKTGWYMRDEQRLGAGNAEASRS